MSLGIGVDCEEISHFKKINKNFLKKVFTKKELDYCKSKPNPPQHLAVRFAGKEAVIKALNSINKKVFFNEIEILNDKNGVPYVKIINNKIRSKRFKIKISLSHSKDNAVAFVLVSS